MYLKSGVALLGRTDPCSWQHAGARISENRGDTGIKRTGLPVGSEAVVPHPAPNVPGALLRPELRRIFCRLLICKQCIKLLTAD